MTPLRKRYIEDLRLRNFSPKTIHVYVHAVAKFARHFGRSPDELGPEEVREYLVHLVERGLSRSCCVVYRNALRHLYRDTLGRSDWLADFPRPKRERRLPVVLSREEVQRLFATVTNLKQKALFMVAYDAGLRLSEILNLRVEDIDSQRMVIRIQQVNFGPIDPREFQFDAYPIKQSPHTWMAYLVGATGVLVILAVLFVLRQHRWSRQGSHGEAIKVHVRKTKTLEADVGDK